MDFLITLACRRKDIITTISILPCLKKTHLTRKIIVFGDKEKCENLFYLQKRSKFLLTYVDKRNKIGRSTSRKLSVICSLIYTLWEK